MDSSNTVATGLFVIFFVIYFIVGLAVYILGALSHHKLYKKAGVKYPWLAWIPVANMWPYMWTIKRSAWNILWLLVPIANIVFGVIWMVRFWKAFGLSPHWLWLILVPYGGGLFIFIQLCYMGFSSKVQYQWKSNNDGLSGGVTA